MKRLLYSIILAFFIILPVEVFAEGYISTSVSSLTIEQGSAKTFSISAYNAIGDVTIRSNNSGIASVNMSEWGTGMVDEKQTKSVTVTVTGVSVGITTITLNIDAATFDEEDLSGQTKKVSVNVVAKPVVQPSNPSGPTPEPKPEQKPESSKNNNNNLKEISVEGQDLVKVDNNNYTLTVNNAVTSINVNAIAEDPKATVTGNGTHELNIGENNIEIVITSEAGSQNIINIKVTRKDGYYIEDLDVILNDDKIDVFDINISGDTKITKDILSKIKDSKKTVKFNYFDENKKLIYSWIVNDKSLKDLNEFLTTITFTPENKKDIDKLSNYADGLYINLSHKAALPNGTKLKIYVGDKFEDESTVNIYNYDSTHNTLNFVEDDIKVVDGYIEFEIKNGSEYFVTMSSIGSTNKKEKNLINIFIVLAIEFFIIIALIIFVLIKSKYNRNNGSDLNKGINN